MSLARKKREVSTDFSHNKIKVANRTEESALREIHHLSLQRATTLERI